ncbi:MAG: hypothetical protein AAF492_27965, partial [Verrucomicrobiota bacterium]
MPPALPAAQPPPIPRSLFFRCRRAVASGLDWLFGVFTLILGIAVFSTMPVLNLLGLGYLLQVSGRVAESGRLRDGFVGVRKAARVGSMVLGIWLMLWPIRFLSGFWKEAALIDPTADKTQFLRVLLVVFTVFMFVHIIWACLRGGRLRHFFWPAPVRFVKWIFKPGKFAVARDAAWDYVAGLRLHHYFWLGLRCFVGTALWLGAPILLLILAASLNPGLGVLFSLAGAFSLSIAILYIPFLQVHFARINRFHAFFELEVVRDAFKRAPVAFAFALFVTLLFALPLHILKIELTPREVAWLPGILFVSFMFPARLLAGWAFARGTRREQPRHGFFRWTGRLTTLAAAGAYVFFLYFTQYLTWHGAFGLLE